MRLAVRCDQKASPANLKPEWQGQSGQIGEAELLVVFLEPDCEGDGYLRRT